MAKLRVRHHVNPLSDRSEYSFAGFGNDRPIIVDIGADRGEFVAGLISQLGDTHNFLVLEIRRPLAVRLEALFADSTNVAVFAGDAVRNIRALLEPALMHDGATIGQIYVNFPDPWFKDRHHKRRVLCQRLIDDVRTWMPPGVMWVYQTDQKALFDDTMQLLRNNNVNHIQMLDSAPYGVSTKWEGAKIAAGDTIYRATFALL